jgi:hypothetical protein
MRCKLAPDGLTDAELEAPTATEPPLGGNVLPLLHELSCAPAGATVTRYQCGCGCEGCICSGERVVEGDEGQAFSLDELCSRIESNLTSFGDLCKVEMGPKELCTLKWPCPCEQGAQIPSSSSC